MDLVIDNQALSRNKASAMALKVLEAALERKLGFPVSIRQIACWASPSLLEEERQPERYVQLSEAGVPELMSPEMQIALDAPRPVSEIRSAKQMIADRKAREKALKEIVRT